MDIRSVDVLWNLSVVMKAGRPIPGAISTLARYHHDPDLRQKLLFVRNEVEQGADLWDTLRAVKLLTSTDVALMETSEKVGNGPWAMGQLATCKRRQVRRRLELFSQLAEPFSVLLLGGVVFTMCLAVFVPLLKMIFYSA
jgi:type II secretory pathway component PulF